MFINKIIKTLASAILIALIIPSTVSAKPLEQITKEDISSGKVGLNSYVNAMWDNAPTYRPVIKRLAGDDRILTAIDIAKEKNQSGGTIIITNCDRFENILVGAAFCYQHDKAIALLTDAASLDSRVATEIKRRKPAHIYILGGTGEISTNVESISHCDTVFLTYNNNYHDALAASTFAAKNGYPILFTDTLTPNEDSKADIQKWGIKT